MGAVTTPVRRPEDAEGDADVLRRIRAGDPKAIDDLYERFRRPAFALARRILGDDVLAEDVLQEVFLSVWRDPSAYERGKGSVAAWLLAVVHHKAVDAVRREESQRRRQALAEDEMVLEEPVAARDVEDDVWTRAVSQQVRTALGELSPPQREALTLAYYGGYTQREVAALTGAPLGTVKTRMLSGMRRRTSASPSASSGRRSGVLTPPMVTRILRSHCFLRFIGAHIGHVATDTDPPDVTGETEVKEVQWDVTSTPDGR